MQAFIAAFAAMMGLFLVALAVIFVFWDTHRLARPLPWSECSLWWLWWRGLILRHKLGHQAAVAGRYLG